MVRRIRAYQYEVVVEPDEGAFHVYVPALKGCHTFGDTEEEAVASIREAAQVHVESLWFDKIGIPASDPEAQEREHRVEAVIPWATA